MAPDNPYATKLETKDGVPLADIMNTAWQMVDLFNEADRPFRDMLAQTVSERVFTTDWHGNMTWEPLAEGEHPVTGDADHEQVAMNIEKYGRALGFTQEFIEDNPSEMVQRRIEMMLEGAAEREHKVVWETFQQGISDGSEELWYEVPDYGAYSFSQTHNHTFGSTSVLFDDDTNPHTPTEHLRKANAQIRHHGRSPSYALCSSEFAAEFVDELAWGADYHIPDATNLRSAALPDTAITIDGVTLMQTPWISDESSAEYTFYVSDGSLPVYFHEARPVQITSPGDAPVRSPGDMLGASGSARYGAKMVDPLAGVKVTADDLA